MSGGRFRLLGRVVALLAFAGRYAVEVLRSGVRVAADVLSPRSRARPRVVRLPLSARTEAEIAVVANLISLTPGTLSLDVTPDRRWLLVHAMFVEDEAELVRSLKDSVEAPVLAFMR